MELDSSLVLRSLQLLLLSYKPLLTSMMMSSPMAQREDSTETALDLSSNQTPSSTHLSLGKSPLLPTLSLAQSRRLRLKHKLMQVVLQSTGHGLMMLNGSTVQLVPLAGTLLSTTELCLRRTLKIQETWDSSTILVFNLKTSILLVLWGEHTEMELLLFSNSTVSSMPSTDLKSHPLHYMLIAISLHMVGWPRIMLSQLFQVMSCRNITCKLLSSLKLVLPLLSLSGMKSQFQMLLLQLLQLLRTNLLHALNVCLKRVPGLLHQVKQRQENTFVSWLSLVQENINAMLRLLQQHQHHHQL